MAAYRAGNQMIGIPGMRLRRAHGIAGAIPGLARTRSGCARSFGPVGRVPRVLPCRARCRARIGRAGKRLMPEGLARRTARRAICRARSIPRLVAGAVGRIRPSSIRSLSRSLLPAILKASWVPPCRVWSGQRLRCAGRGIMRRVWRTTGCRTRRTGMVRRCVARATGRMRGGRWGSTRRGHRACWRGLGGWWARSSRLGVCLRRWMSRQAAVASSSTLYNVNR